MKIIDNHIVKVGVGKLAQLQIPPSIASYCHIRRLILLQIALKAIAHVNRVHGDTLVYVGGENDAPDVPTTSAADLDPVQINITVLPEKPNYSQVPMTSTADLTPVQTKITVLADEPNYSQDKTLTFRRVEARKTGGGGDEMLPGTIVGVHYDGSFDVEFDNGEKEMFIPRPSIRLL